MKKLVMLVLIMLAMVACDVNPSKISQEDADKYAEKITYMKDYEHNICYAVIASRKTGHASQTGLGMTSVPCEKVGLLGQ